jgi:DNA polymerase
VAKLQQPRLTRAVSRAESDALDQLRKKAADCRGCGLWRNATQTVFGSGPKTARLMLVGEQPGYQEDLAGEPFVGAAGRLLRDALDAAGLDPGDIYLTNAVKHFKWTPRGKRRIHERPNHEEILACRVWLDGEIAQIKPHALVALGATAAGVIVGPNVRVTRDRGRALDSTLAPFVAVTVHPSILRSPDSESRKLAMRQFVDDLKLVARELKKAGR